MLMYFHPKCELCRQLASEIAANSEKFINIHIVMATSMQLDSLASFRQKFLPGDHTRPPRPHLPGPDFGGWGYGDLAATTRPTFTEAAIQGWRQIGTVRTADMLGLYARENIIFGNVFINKNIAVANPAWDAAMESVNEANLGIDGVRATTDVGEGDGSWNVVRFGDATSCGSGLLPPGFSVGQVIPCLQEDIDCDARRDVKGALGWVNFFGVPVSGASILAAGESILDRPRWNYPNDPTVGIIDTDGDGSWWGGSAFYNQNDTCCSAVFDSDDTGEAALHYQYQVPIAAPIDQIHGTLYTPHSENLM